jgi:hypothetical protein
MGSSSTEAGAHDLCLGVCYARQGSTHGLSGRKTNQTLPGARVPYRGYPQSRKYAWDPQDRHVLKTDILID